MVREKAYFEVVVPDGDVVLATGQMVAEVLSSRNITNEEKANLLEFMAKQYRGKNDD